MTGRELLVGMTDLDGRILEEAEEFRTEIPVRRFRPALAAAIGAAVLILAGCTYVALTEPEWFGQFFSRWQEQGLSQSQAAFVEENTKVIGQSVTKDGYTLTVESAIADSQTAYIKLRLEAPIWRKLDADQYADNPSLLEDGSWDPILSIQGSGEPIVSLGNWSNVVDEDSKGNTVFILLRLDKNLGMESANFESQIPYRLCIHGLSAYYGDNRKPDGKITDEIFEFIIEFDQINADALEFVDSPIPTNWDGIAVEITSFQLHTMSVFATYSGRADEKGFACIQDAAVVLRDGTRLNISMKEMKTIGPGYSQWYLPGPIVLEEVDYVQLRDGTKLYPPEK